MQYMKKELQKMLSWGQTVFSVNMLTKYLNEADDISLRKKISYYMKVWYLKRPTRGLYSISWTEINSKELANKMFSPSYISFETALYYHWIIFQVHPNQVDLAYKKSDTRELQELNLTIKLRCLKTDILLSPEWLIYQENYTIAVPERAFLDMIYLNKDYYFDNLEALDIQKIRELLFIYRRDKLMTQRVQSYFPNI